MDEIEIIIVDDFSSDNTSELVLKLQEEDPRIKYIKNKENRGTLY
jgi:glycosyltransferase involved in cell wall biosynthesis